MNFLPPSGFYQEITRGTTMSSPSSSSTLHQILNPPAEEQTLQLGHGSSSEKEHMFDKVVTPSDVGKLNRLVIPKQHAEKYFPLDASTNEKGLLLNFEDSNGKPWRFRYSYWNSSQSYVMTKGWSRFVKEKNFEAGDIVSFSRGMAQPDRLFIDWRRRPDAFPMLHSIPTHHYHPFYLQQRPREYSHYIPYPDVKYAPNYGTIVNGNPCVPGSVIYMRSNNSNSRIAPRQMVYESVPVVEGKVAAKRLRLFGVNMDCPVDSGSDIEYCDNAPMLPFHLLTGPDITTSSSNSSSLIHNSVAYGRNAEKGKGSMSLDLDI